MLTWVGRIGTASRVIREPAIAEDFLYIRCELFGKGGICLTQALVIDDGSVPLVYEEEKTFDSVLKDLIFEFKCTRFYVIIQELVRLIVDELKG